MKTVNEFDYLIAELKTSVRFIVEPNGDTTPERAQFIEVWINSEPMRSMMIAQFEEVNREELEDEMTKVLLKPNSKVYGKSISELLEQDQSEAVYWNRSKEIFPPNRDHKETEEC